MRVWGAFPSGARTRKGQKAQRLRDLDLCLTNHARISHAYSLFCMRGTRSLTAQALHVIVAPGGACHTAPDWDLRSGIVRHFNISVLVGDNTNKGVSVHIPFKKLKSDKLLSAITYVQTDEVKRNVAKIAEQIRNENGLENAVSEIEKYFS